MGGGGVEKRASENGELDLFQMSSNEHVSVAVFCTGLGAVSLSTSVMSCLQSACRITSSAPLEMRCVLSGAPHTPTHSRPMPG